MTRQRVANVSQFTAKTLNKQSTKALKDEKTEKNKLKKVLSLSLVSWSSSSRLTGLWRDAIGAPTGQHRRRTDIRRECDPEEERGPQLAPAFVPD